MQEDARTRAASLSLFRTSSADTPVHGLILKKIPPRSSVKLSDGGQRSEGYTNFEYIFFWKGGVLVY